MKNNKLQVHCTIQAQIVTWEPRHILLKTNMHANEYRDTDVVKHMIRLF